MLRSLSAAGFRPALRSASLLLLSTLLVVAGCADDPVGPDHLALDDASATSVSVVPRVDVGGSSTCVLRSAGAIECWSGSGSARRALEAASGHYVDMSVGLYDAWLCALRDDGVIDCHENFAGGPRYSFAPATGAFVQVSAMDAHVCGLRDDGVIQCFGVDDAGDGFAPDSVVATTGTFTAVAAGLLHGCGLRSGGDLQCWGYNENGEADAERSAPGGLAYVAIAAGQLNTCAVRDDGVVECFGSGITGTDLYTPTTGTFVSIQTTGADNLCGLRDDGGLECTYALYLPDGPVTRVGGYSDAGIGGAIMCGARPDGLIECFSSPPHTAGIRIDVPFEPDSLAASYAGGAIDIDWNDNSLAESHTSVQRRTGANGVWFSRATLGVDADSLVDTQLVSGLVYQYRIQSCNALGCSAWITTPLIDTNGAAPTIPAAPGTVTVTGLALTSFSVSWQDLSSDETSFLVQRQTRNALGVWSTWSDVAVKSAGATAHHDSSAVPGTAQRYRVRSCNVAGCSAFAASGPVRTPVPAVPLGLTATTIHPMRIDLAWGDASSDESGFDVQRRAYDGSTWEAWTVLTSTAAGVTTYMDEDVHQGGRYLYRIRACSIAGCSVWSTVAYAVAEVPPLAPSNVVASPTSPSRFVISWTDESDGETSFRVLRRGQIEGVWQTPEVIAVTDPNVTSVADAGLPSGATYRYLVRACNLAGCSPTAAAEIVMTP